jgi:hypothetical protein
MVLHVYMSAGGMNIGPIVAAAQNVASPRERDHYQVNTMKKWRLSTCYTSPRQFDPSELGVAKNYVDSC